MNNSGKQMIFLRLPNDIEMCQLTVWTHSCMKKSCSTPYPALLHLLIQNTGLICIYHIWWLNHLWLYTMLIYNDFFAQRPGASNGKRPSPVQGELRKVKLSALSRNHTSQLWADKSIQKKTFWALVSWALSSCPRRVTYFWNAI